MKENTPLSSESQAVIDALGVQNTALELVARGIAAGALRAAADQLDHATSAHVLYAIADELEAL